MNQESHPHRSCCEEYAKLSRRRFVSASALGAAAAASAPAWLPRVAMAQGTGGPNRDVLVHVFLRGAMDGLSLCVPYGDPAYYAARPQLALNAPGQPNGVIDLDGFFGLNFNAQAMMPAYSNGHLAFVQASGLPDPTRSHFDAQRLMEAGISDVSPGAVSDGWYARHLRGLAPVGNGNARALALNKLLPFVLQGAGGVLPVKDGSGFNFPGRPATEDVRRALMTEFFEASEPPLRPAALATFETIELLQTIDFSTYQTAGGIQYPNTLIGQRLRAAATLIHADLGVECLSFDYDDWDHHVQLGPRNGIFARQIEDLSQAIEAFYADLLARGTLDSVTTVVMSEFGRRVAENFSNGTDHGHGNTMIALGGHIAGGQVHGTWPGLDPANLDEGDLAITTDFRDILGEIATERLGTSNIDTVFPGHSVTPIGITV